ncbi:MAG: hypothetical protein IJO22_05250 [Oscillospiraceae bacterium]|nr:hypothetical protein [Oscillospiraceae bacterium]
MKRTVFTVIIMLILAISFVSCGWKVEIIDPTNPIEGESELVISKEEKEKENSENENSEKEEQNKAEDKEPALLGEYVFLKDFDERTSYHFIEFADRIVIYSVSGEISAFDIVTGEKIYEFFLGDINEMQAFDLVKTNEKEGFDYRVLWKDRIIYLSSKEPEKIEEVLLPENIMKTAEGYASYSVFEGKIIWKAPEGIRMMDMETGEESLILDNAVIAEKVRPLAEVAIEGMWIGDNGVECTFEIPRFICGGTKIAVTAVSRDYVFWMIALYDIEKNEFEWVYSFNEMVNTEYPVADKYVVIGEKWINAESGNYKNFAAEDYVLKSCDGTEFIKVSWDDMDGNGMKVFAGNFENIENGGEKIAEITRENVRGHIVAITENYIVIRVFEDEVTDHYIVKYR